MGQRLMETLAAATAEEENDTWVQCDRCTKWRRLELSGSAALPEEWSCDLNPNRAFASCQIAEEICEIAEETVPDRWDKIHWHSLTSFCRHVRRNNPKLDAHPTGVVKMREWLRVHWRDLPSSPAPTPT